MNLQSLGHNLLQNMTEMKKKKFDSKKDKPCGGNGSLV
jgi:hypothetical protein